VRIVPVRGSNMKGGPEKRAVTGLIGPDVMDQNLTGCFKE
jgi:hypothetical protein